MKWLWTVLLTLAGVASAQAFTCEDVRALSAEQRAYYIRVYNITPAQQDRIRQACYGSKAPRVIAVSDDKSTASLSRNEREGAH